MNRGTLRTNIRLNIEDQGSFYTDGDLNSAIQECYQLYINEVNVIEKKVTLDFEDDLVYYDMSALVNDYLIPTALFNNVNKTWLDARSRLWLDGYRLDWETSTGEPRWFSVINHKLIALVPHQEVATGTFDLHYLAFAPILTNDTTLIKVLSESEHIFEIYAQFYLMMQAREFNKAKMSLQEFEREIKSAINLTQKRGLPSRQYRLGGF